MSIVKELEKTTEKIQKDLSNNRAFRELEDFYREMKERGVAKTAKYDLPPVDTLGKRFYDIRHSADKKNFV
ncbi:MAG: hypothetical protein IT172_02165 [Acidobacteria bacterium]|nr:hypothetical protein [Acidobacteriota bacterium]